MSKEVLWGESIRLFMMFFAMKCIMGSRFCFVFVILCFTALLILTVYLRLSNNHSFYELRRYEAERNQLKQQLWQKQLMLEGMINPAAVSDRLEGSDASKREQPGRDTR